MTLYDTSVHGAHIPRICRKNDLELIVLKNYLELNYLLKRVVIRNVTAVFVVPFRPPAF